MIQQGGIYVPVLTYLLIALVFVIVGAVATILIAISKENKHGNPAYDKEKKKTTLKLTIYYAVATVIGVLIFIIYMLSK